MGSRRKSAPGPAQDTDLLEVSPFESDLEAELAARPARTVRPGLTVYLGAGVLLVAGFVGGIQADKHWGSGSSSATALPAGIASALRNGGGGAGGAGRRSGAAGTPGGGQQQGFGGGATFGTVKLVDGTTVYVDTGAGGIVAVKTDGSTKINISRAGTVKDLPPGSTVVVQGTPGSDGSVTASTIVQGGLGARRGGG